MSELNLVSSPSTTTGNPLLQIALTAAQWQQSQKTPTREFGRLEQLQILGVGEGHSIPIIFGRIRLGGQLIWQGGLKEHVHESGGGKSSSVPQQRHYSYSTHFAVGLCAGEISHIGRVWADGRLLDLSKYIMRVNNGTADQSPDPLIQSVEGENTPAYRSLAYVVFQDFDLSSFGNRIPQLSFEVFRRNEEAANLIRGVNIIPGATEFAYAPDIHVRAHRWDIIGENVNASPSLSDWHVSIDALQDACPACKQANLVVAWYGTDLRAGECVIEPRVLDGQRRNLPRDWFVAGRGRGQVNVVSQVRGRPAFGGTPNDQSIIDAIKDLKTRGIAVTFYPFLMMDIPAGNNLPNFEGGRGQPAYPWRGQISVYPQNVNGTKEAYNQLHRFVYGADGKSGLNGMMVHYANLCAQAGGVEAFLIGSEFAALSRVSQARGDYVFAKLLKEVAANVRKILPNTKISYASNWDEYGHYVEHEYGDVNFPLDEFWADENCDFIAIDAYFPLSDWRDGMTHLDAKNGARSISDIDYLKSNIEGGEYYDWYYASQEDRDKQTRTPITEWVFRSKDIRNWWLNTHYTRRNWQQDASTPWQAQSKPIWLTEIGCPAVDKGSNEPNQFPDKNAAAAAAGLPHYSNGQRDDVIQRHYIRAISEYFEDPAHNPVSSVYHAPMLARDKISIWAWDARPFPVFPYNTGLWADGVNWFTGHWLNGRVSSAGLADMWRHIADDQLTINATHGSVAVEGYLIDGQHSAREAMEPLLQSFGLDAVADGQGIKISDRGQAVNITPLTEDDLLAGSGRAVLQRDDVSLLPNLLQLQYLRDDGAYETAIVTARVNEQSLPQLRLSVPLVMSRGRAETIAARLLHEVRTEYEHMRFILPPRFVFLEPADILSYQGKLWRIVSVTYQGALEIEAIHYEPALYSNAQQDQLYETLIESVAAVARPELHILELPIAAQLANAQNDWPEGAPLAAVSGRPWPSSVLIEDDTNIWSQELTRPSILGVTQSDMKAAPIGRFLKTMTIDIEISDGELESRSALQVLNGLNAFAVRTEKGWEIIQFGEAQLIGERRYRLSHILRGAMGSDDMMVELLPAGADCVFLSTALRPLNFARERLVSEVEFDYGPAQLQQGTYAWRKTSYQLTNIAYRPLSPVHLKAKSQANGNLAISWIRRGRIDADNFETEEIPLGEEREQYRIRLYADGAIVKDDIVDAPDWQFTSAMRDNSKTYKLHVAQISATYGAGAEAVLNL